MRRRDLPARPTARQLAPAAWDAAAFVVIGHLTTFLRRGWTHHDIQVIMGKWLS
jgi:hypothetical protein